MKRSTRSGLHVDAVESFVALLSRSGDSSSSTDFYSRLCEATCRLTAMDRAVIFRYDEGERRVRAAGAYGIDLDLFADADLDVESAPLARKALEEDRVIDVSDAAERLMPASYRDLLRDATLVCTPISAGGHWSGVLLSDRAPRKPLTNEERHLLWTIGKSAALATYARIATVQQVKARQLKERITLTREIHEGVIQRLFGVLLVFSSNVELTGEARDRCASEIQTALLELRKALQRPVAPRQLRSRPITFQQQLERLQEVHSKINITVANDSELNSLPHAHEELAQSILAEAVRNANKHASPSAVEVSAFQTDSTWSLEIVNDGVTGQSFTVGSGVGLRLAAFEALQAGGSFEFGPGLEPETWRVYLSLPINGN